MTCRRPQLAYEDELVVAGKVIDEDGNPVARAAVTLVSGDRRLAQGATAERRHVRFEVEAEIIGHGPVRHPGRSRDPGRLVRQAEPQPPRDRATIARAAAGAGLVHDRRVHRDRARRRRVLRRAHQAVAPLPPPRAARRGASEEGEIEQTAGGLVVAKPGVMSTLRRPHDDGFSGVVRDTVRGRPVADAVVRARARRRRARGPHRAPTAASRSRSSRPASGAPRSRRPATSPSSSRSRSRTAASCAACASISCRCASACSSSIAAPPSPVLPESRLWGIWSPRQIVDHVRSEAAEPRARRPHRFRRGDLLLAAARRRDRPRRRPAERVDRAIASERAPPAA